MKRLLTSAAMFLCSLLALAQSAFGGSGDGTEEAPYLIYNVDQLAQVSNFLNQEGVVFKLMKDLDLTDWIAENNPKQGWLPIGIESLPFKGIFYGNNKTISGLMINRASTNYVGFWGSVSGAAIENLTIEGSTVVGNDNVGVFFGYVSGTTINNCHVKMTGDYGVKGNSCVGVFAGYSVNTEYYTFTSSASVTATDKTGGFIGRVDNGIFSDGTTSGNVVGGSNYTGGLLGWATACALTNISVNSTVYGQDYTGGMMGYCATGCLTNCKYEGSLAGKQFVGGLSGSLETAATSFVDCYTKGKIAGTGDYVGGLVGVSKGACIEDMEKCSHFGDVSGHLYVGGLIGAVISAIEAPVLHRYEARTSSDYNSGNNVGWYEETMISGESTTKYINNCVAIGNVKGDSFVGGLIGGDTTAKGYTVVSSHSTPYRSGTRAVPGTHGPQDHTPQKPYNPSYTYYYIFDGQSYVGYCVDYYDYKRNTISLSLTNNYYSGILYGTDNVGGLLGYKSGGSIQNNYTYAIIYGSSNVGGIVGQISAEIIDGSYTTTTVKSNISINDVISATSSNVGRIYGLAETDYTIIGALASTEGNRALSHTKLILQGVVQEVDDDLQNGTSIGSSALKLKANYVSWGWNFDENWNILQSESFPYKKYQAAPPVIESLLVSNATSISGKSINGGKVYMYYKDRDAVSTISNGNNWSFSTEPLQSGAQVSVYAEVEGMTPSYLATSFVGYPGSGTKDDPYRIYTAEDLQGASNRGYYKLMNDIDLTDWIIENSPTEGWPAIGRNSGEATYIDGDNHKVTGLWTDTQENYNGLFSNFSAGQIKNLTVEVASGKKVKGGDYSGVLIGRNANGSIINCTVKGDVEGGAHTGGVAGCVLASTIRDVSYNGTVTSVSDNVLAGGLVGQAENCTISACDAKAVINLSGKGGKVGGLIGESIDGTIKSSNAQPALTATGEDYYVGGLVGYSETPITICSSGGSVSVSGDNSYAGGLVGYTLSPIENSYSLANTTGTLYTAGLVGYTFNRIDKCYAKGDVYGSRYGAGVVAELDGADAALTNSVACNNIVSLSDQYAWGCRVVGGFRKGASEPDNSNFALSTMQVSLNNVTEKKTDDPIEGIAITQSKLFQKSTYTQLGWDFTNVWEIDEGAGYPTLRAVATVDEGGGEYVPDDPIDPNEPETVNVTDISAFTDAIYVETISSQPGLETTLTISLKNAKAATAYSFDLQLPAGVSLVKNNEEDYQYTLSNRHNGHAETVNAQTGGVYSIAVLSLQSKEIRGNDGAIWTLRLKVSDNVANGEYAIKISNAKYSSSIGTSSVNMPETVGKLTVSQYKRGDVNSDGDVDIADAVCIVNHVVGLPTPTFVSNAADANGDGSVDIADAVRIVNLVVGKINALSRGNSSRIRAATRAGDATDAIYIDDTSAFIGKEGTLTVSLKNTQATNAYSFDMVLPEGVSIVQDDDDEYVYELSERHNGHTSTLNYIGYNTYSFAILSLQSKEVSGNDGTICTFNLKVDDKTAAGKYSISIKNAKYSLTSGASKVTLPEATGQLTIKKLGDANGDGDVTEADVEAVAKHIMGQTPTGFDEDAADVNGDKVVNVADIVEIVKMKK